MKILLSIILFFTVLVGAIWQSGFIKIEQKSDQSDTAPSKIETIAYANWVPVSKKNADKKGVTYKEESQVYHAYALYAPANMAKAFLVDIDGKEVHSWEPHIPGSQRWQQVTLLEDGSLLAIDKDSYLAKLDWSSKVIWILPGRYHHEITVSKDNLIYALRRGERYFQYKDKYYPILDDYIDQISSDGKIIKSYSVYDIVKEYIYSSQYNQIMKAAHKDELIRKEMPNQYIGKRLVEDFEYDILHTNAITVIDRDIPNIAKTGDLIISVRNIDLIGVFSINDNKLTWVWGQGELEKQHMPTLLENDKILIFDNRPKKKFSRLVEVDMVSNRITWEFSSKKPKFFSFSRGSAQRLPNGNTLITQSDSGKVFEINNSGQIVWEFYNPYIQYNKQGKPAKRSAIYRMIKYPNFELVK